MRRIKALAIGLGIFIVNNSFAVSIDKWQTDEGMQVLYVQTQGLPIVDLSLNIKSGSASDPKDKVNLARLTQTLLISSNAKYSEEAVAKKMADLGAQYSANVSEDYSQFGIRLINDKNLIEQALELWTNLITKPSFDNKILEREISRAIASFRENLVDPAFVGERTFKQAVYGSHPYGFLEDEQSYKNIKVSDLEKYYQQHYYPQNVLISIVGALTTEEAKALAQSISKAFVVNKKNINPKNQDIEKTIAPELTHSSSVKKEFIYKKFPSQQAHIFIGNILIERGNPDFFPLSVGNYILGGGGFASKLMQIVREDNGLAYSINSSFSPLKYKGEFVINLQTASDNTEKVLSLVKTTLTNFINNEVSNEELTKAKAYLTGSFPLRLDSNAKIIGLVSMIGIYNLPLNYLDTWIDNISAVRAEDIRSAFRKYINPEDLVVVVVGPKEISENR